MSNTTMSNTGATTTTKSIEGILDVSDGVLGCHITSYLSARDNCILPLVTCKKAWSSVMEMHDEKLFRKHMEQDFCEGEMLIKSFQGRLQEEEKLQQQQEQFLPPALSFLYKKLYLAFQGQWN